MPRVKAGDIWVAYEDEGEGQPLLLISGVGYGAWFWHKVMPGLAKHFRVIAIDNRGAGGTEKPAGPYTVAMMAKDVANLLQAIGIERAHILGHSLGGYIAQELAVNHPERIDKLVLASTTYGGMNVLPITPEALEVMTNREGDPMDLIRRGIAVAAAPGFAEKKPDIVQELIDYRLTGPVPASSYQAQVTAGAAMVGMTDEEVRERMRLLDMPVLLLFGEHDRVVPPGNAELMAQKLPNAEIKILPGTGHIFPIEDPEATIKAIISFLEK